MTPTATTTKTRREQMDIVMVGHVDHGKSTVIGRLLADTGSLPEGKLDQVKAMCAANARPFEYAFLLDALKAEQAQGITIDTARSFFHTEKRNYIIHDAPGHIEFLKNMLTGAARAESALLVIDAHEGIQENSRRHGFLLSMLGIKSIAVLVNKMDIVDHSQEVFEAIAKEYTEFLEGLEVHPTCFIPISAREGDNIASRSVNMPWYDGLTVLDQIDAFEKPQGKADGAFRLPVQDIYKFTAGGDDRRIVAGTVESGSITTGEEIVFYPSGKRSHIKTFEAFNTEPPARITPGMAVGVTMNTQIYIKPGELMCRASEEPPHIGTRFRASLFWMGRQPMIRGKQYFLKLGGTRVAVELAETIDVLDASAMSSLEGKQAIDRHDVAVCILETSHPIAFDRRNDVEATGRFVIVDEYDIAGAGIILEPLDVGQASLKQELQRRAIEWEKGLIRPEDRMAKYSHQGKFMIFNGPLGCGKRELAKKVERVLFHRGCNTYYFGIANLFAELDHENRGPVINRDEHLQRLGELARVMTDAGVIFITTVQDVDDYEIERLKLLNAPSEIFVVNLGESPFSRIRVDLELPEQPEMREAVKKIVDSMTEHEILLDYSI